MVRQGRQIKSPLTPLGDKGGKLKKGLDRAGVIGYKSPLPGRRQGWPGGAEKNPQRGVDTEGELGYKNSCRSGGHANKKQTNPLTTAGKLLQ